jgi:predicted membrane protein
MKELVLRKFGITIATALAVLGWLIILKHKTGSPLLFFSAIILFALTYLLPVALKPLYFIWMRIALALAWVNTRLILFVIFYGVFAVPGLVLRLCKKDLLGRKIERGQESYWLKKEKVIFNPRDYERQF